MKILKLAYMWKRIFIFILAIVFIYFAYSFYDEYSIKANKKPEKPRVISQEDIKNQMNIVNKNDCDNFRTNSCKNNIVEVNQINDHKIFRNSIKAFVECRDEKIYGIFWVKLSFDISGFDYYGFDLHHSDDKILMHDKKHKALVEVYRKQDLLNDSKAYKIIIYGNNDEVAVFDLDEEEKPHKSYSYIYEKNKITARRFSNKEFKKYTGSIPLYNGALQKYLNRSKELVPANQILKKHNHNHL